MFALPAYLVLGVALTGLLRSRGASRRGTNAWLDGAVVCLGAAADRVRVRARPDARRTATPGCRRSSPIAIYPPLSALLVTIACRLAFGSSRRSPSHQMVFVGMVCLLVGDIVFAMEEVGTLSIGRFYELPFLVASALFGAAALHPSMRHLNRPSTRQHRAADALAG